MRLVRLEIVVVHVVVVVVEGSSGCGSRDERKTRLGASFAFVERSWNWRDGRF